MSKNINKINQLRQEIRDLQNESQWAPASRLDSFDERIQLKEDEIKRLKAE